MKSLSFFIITILTLTINSFGQIDLPDLKEIKWDMPRAEIISLYMNKLKFLEKSDKYIGRYCDFVIENYQYEGRSFVVHFLMDSISNRLTNIYLKSTKIESEQNVTLDIVEEYYTFFQNRLTNKYGIPAYCTSSEHGKNCNWFCKDFHVGLSFLHWGDLNFFDLTFEKLETGFDFRKTNWGMSRLDVKKVEDQKLIEEKDDILLYSTSILNLNTSLIYIFVNDKLTRTKYSVTESHTNKNDYLTDYQKVKEMISKKYGKPYSDEIVWRNDLYKTDFQNWGTAVSIGHLYFYAKWRTQKSDIYLILKGDNFDINLVVEYTSKQFEKLEDEINQKTETDKF